MTQTIQLLVVPIEDIARAKKLYSRLLATEPYADAPYYVGFRVADQEIGLDPNGHKAGLTGRSPTGRRPTSERRCNP